MTEEEILVEGWPPPDHRPETERWRQRLTIRHLLAATAHGRQAAVMELDAAAALVFDRYASEESD